MISSDTNMMRTFSKYFYKLMHVSYFALQDEKNTTKTKRFSLRIGTQARGRTHSSEIPAARSCKPKMGRMHVLTVK